MAFNLPEEWTVCEEEPEITTPKSALMTHKALKTSSMGATYNLALAELSAGERKKIEQQLTIQPTSKCQKPTSRTKKQKISDGKDQDQAKSFPLFRIVQDKWLQMPRFFGLERFGKPATLNYSEGLPLSSTIQCNIKLQPERHQDTAVAKVLAALHTSAGHGGVLSLPCGYGKTESALYAACKLGRKTLILVNGNTSKDVWLERIPQRLQNARVGLLQQNTVQIRDRDFVVGMIHSIVKRPYPDLDQFGLVVVDEAHHIAARTFSQAMFLLPAKYVLALSATFRRQDGLDDVLHWLMGPMLFHTGRDPGNMLVHQIVYREQDYHKRTFPSTNWGFSQALKCIKQDKDRNDLVVSLVLFLLNDPMRQIIVIAKHLDTLDLLRKSLESLEVNGLGEYTSRRKLHEGKRVILATMDMAKESLNIETLNALVFAHPVGDIEQVSGRIMRGHFSVRPLVFDVVDEFAHFKGMGWKRYRQYQKLKYQVIRTGDTVVGSHLKRRVAQVCLGRHLSPNNVEGVLNMTGFGNDCKLKRLHNVPTGIGI